MSKWFPILSLSPFLLVYTTERLRPLLQLKHTYQVKRRVKGYGQNYIHRCHSPRLCASDGESEIRCDSTARKSIWTFLEYTEVTVTPVGARPCSNSEVALFLQNEGTNGAIRPLLMNLGTSHFFTLPLIFKQFQNTVVCMVLHGIAHERSVIE